MVSGDIEAVMRIERRIYPYPWTQGNFSDALNSGYLCQVAELGGKMIGYVVIMPAVDEVQLLNLGIDAAYQGKGLGGALLEEAMAQARAQQMQRMLLEVRPSNIAALALYRKHGFREIGLRRGYYPADNGREDAMVMERIL
ncbi:MAG: ribosomal-protein-alanine N-acetyltransferase [Sideroxydans sp.]|nr:ribosomal-protein-alanine N-acetyltransferase [Sideroxydans sp.]